METYIMFLFLILATAIPNYITAVIPQCDESISVEARSDLTNCLFAKGSDAFQAANTGLLACTGYDSAFDLMQEICKNLGNLLELEYLSRCMDEAGPAIQEEYTAEMFKECARFAGIEL